jgi:hypothetical protein
LTPSFGGSARADALSAVSPIVEVVLKDGGNVSIRTWDRPEIEVDGDPTIQINRPRVPSQQIDQYFRQFSLRAMNVQTPEGPLSLPPEQFPIPALPPGQHDALLVRGEGDVQLTIPADTALVEIQVSQGSISIEGYRGGTILAQMGGGTIHLANVGGTAAIQLNNGPFIARNSSFDLLRVRTGRGNMFFANCHVTQIQASSLLGSIIYDDGTFEPGLARFESTRGNVAIGVSNNDARFLGHSDSGQLYAGNEVNLIRTGNDAHADLSRSGPVVSASSSTGKVIFYRGALRIHPQLRSMLQEPGGLPPRPPRPPHRLRAKSL